MRVILTTFLFLLFLTNISGQDGTEIVQFDQLTKDLGFVKPGSKAEASFSFTNISKKEVKIDIVSTCECTEATWTKRGIPPGGQGQINFVFDSTKKEKEEPVDIDIYFVNINPKTGNPYSVYLQYTFTYVAP